MASKQHRYMYRAATLHFVSHNAVKYTRIVYEILDREGRTRIRLGDGDVMEVAGVCVDLVETQDVAESKVKALNWATGTR